jgi:hypothetical protein
MKLAGIREKAIEIKKIRFCEPCKSIFVLSSNVIGRGVLIS